VADSVSASINPVQALGPDAVEDIVLAEPSRVELRGRYHAMLARRDSRDGSILESGAAVLGEKVGHIPTKTPGTACSSPR
jgi:hypothetical protein